MNVEKELIISILKLTRNGLVSHELISKDATIGSRLTRELLQEMQNDDLVNFKGSLVETSSLQRFKLAIQALHLRADLERVAGFLTWQEFEHIAAFAFEQNGFNVHRNFHFTYEQRRYEIDIVACKRPLVVCADCKHWHRHLPPSSLKEVVKEQVARASVFASFSKGRDQLGCAWADAKIIPAVLTLTEGHPKFLEKVPVVPILQLQDFILQLPAYADSVTRFLKVSSACSKHDCQNKALE
ncbi:MAG: restriction endonuclease [Candidatus Bathyarchaeota archaeon]|nr:restriction endonuclease [Candidatus Bathyarchaeota archaeon]